MSPSLFRGLSCTPTCSRLSVPRYLHRARHCHRHRHRYQPSCSRAASTCPAPMLFPLWTHAFGTVPFLSDPVWTLYAVLYIVSVPVRSLWFDTALCAPHCRGRGFHRPACFVRGPHVNARCNPRRKWGALLSLPFVCAMVDSFSAAPFSFFHALPSHTIGTLTSFVPVGTPFSFC